MTSDNYLDLYKRYLKRFESVFGEMDSLFQNLVFKRIVLEE